MYTYAQELLNCFAISLNFSLYKLSRMSCVICIYLFARKLTRTVRKKNCGPFHFHSISKFGGFWNVGESSSNCIVGEFWYNYSSIISPGKRRFCNETIANNALKGYEWIIYFSSVFYTYAHSLANQACTFKVKISRTAPALSN